MGLYGRRRQIKMPPPCSTGPLPCDIPLEDLNAENDDKGQSFKVNLYPLTRPRAGAISLLCLAETGEEYMADKKPNEEPIEPSDRERLANWMDSVAGSVYVGTATLKSVKESKDGNKITIVLKKKKQKKAAD
jgi:hypothetical protein